MENRIDSVKSYRYELTLPKNSKNPKHLLIALHGYGQLAKYFIRKFDWKDAPMVVAPEGPHRFYLKGASGRVGASWMTKEAREMDIEENLRWLSKLYEKIQQVYAPEKITLLGFSQGAATAARWYQKHPDGFDQLILWAAVFPPDIEAGTFPTEKPLHFVLGTQDEYYQGDAAKSLLASYENLGFRVHFFDGKHEIQERVLTSILST